MQFMTFYFFVFKYFYLQKIRICIEHIYCIDNIGEKSMVNLSRYVRSRFIMKFEGNEKWKENNYLDIEVVVCSIAMSTILLILYLYFNCYFLYLINKSEFRMFKMKKKKCKFILYCHIVTNTLWENVIKQYK